MKKILSILSIVFLLTTRTLTFACTDKDLHEGVQAILDSEEIPIYQKENKIFIEGKELTLLVLYANSFDQEAAEEKIQIMVIGLDRYAKNHNLELELLENK